MNERYKMSDMQYEYAWTARTGDDPRITGKPDSTLLNRKEGYEVKYLINKIMEKHDYKSVAAGNKIEDMIKIYVPDNIHSQEKIVEWIEANWNKY